MVWMNIVWLVLLAGVVVYLLVNYKKVVGFIEALRTFSSEVSYEMSKVIWPTREEVVNSTILVMVVVLILTAIVWVIDYILGHFIGKIF
jgi:preprotein translocase subunit SecE